MHPVWPPGDYSGVWLQIRSVRCSSAFILGTFTTPHALCTSTYCCTSSHTHCFSYTHCFTSSSPEIKSPKNRRWKLMDASNASLSSSMSCLQWVEKLFFFYFFLFYFQLLPMFNCLLKLYVFFCCFISLIFMFGAKDKKGEEKNPLKR